MVVTALLASGFKLTWQSPDKPKTRASQNKVKYTCPVCEQNAWAKSGAALICGFCSVRMNAVDETRSVFLLGMTA